MTVQLCILPQSVLPEPILHVTSSFSKIKNHQSFWSFSFIWYKTLVPLKTWRFSTFKLDRVLCCVIEDVWISMLMGYARSRFFLLNSSCTRRIITFNITSVIFFRLKCKTRWQMFLLFYVVILRYMLVPLGRAPPHQHGISIQSYINLGEILFRITREWKTPQT